MSGAAVVRAEAVEKTFRRGSETVRALRGADLVLHAGELVGVRGPSGSGKSTLLAVLCGWETPDAGRVEVLGTDDPLRLGWGALALLPQTLGLLDDLPARENVLLPARLGDGDAAGRAATAARADATMARLQVDHLASRFCDQMSLGEQQRVAVARALVLSPALLLADEPTAHQDHVRGDVVLDLLGEYVAGGGCALVVSHDERALARADRVLAMSDGVLVDAAEAAA